MSSRPAPSQHQTWQHLSIRAVSDQIGRWKPEWIRMATVVATVLVAAAVLAGFRDAAFEVQAILMVALVASGFAADRVMMRQAQEEVEPAIGGGVTQIRAQRNSPTGQPPESDLGPVRCSASVSGCKVAGSLKLFLDGEIEAEPGTELPQVANDIARRACELLDARVSWVHWFQDARMVPEIVSFHAREPLDAQTKRGTLIEGSRRLVEQARVATRDVATRDHEARNPLAAMPLAVKPLVDGKYAVVPLGCQNHVHGALTVFGSRLMASDPQLASGLLAAAAAQASLAIDNALLRETQRELLAKMHQLRAHRADYVATISHELRTPLTSIKGFAQLLMRGDDMPADVSYSYARTIATESEKLVRIVTDIVDLTRMETGLLELNRRPVHLSDLVSNVLEFLRPIAISRPVEVDIPSSLPAVRGDPEILSQVIRRLIVDCISHSAPNSILHLKAEAGESELTIRLEYRPSGGRVDDLIHVLGGIGQKSGDGQATQLGRGTLGLYIAKNYIEAHGGRLWVDSSEAQLAQIAFTLPY